MAEVVLSHVPPSELNRSDKGAVSELVVCTELARAGYHVYRAESPSAPFDLVAYRDGQCLRVEVKGIGQQAKEKFAPSFSWPRNSLWDLLAVVGQDRVFFFDSATTVDEARDVLRAHYGHEPLSTVRSLQPCGTLAGYQRHHKHAESACAECREAQREYVRSRRSAA